LLIYRYFICIVFQEIPFENTYIYFNILYMYLVLFPSCIPPNVLFLVWAILGKHKKRNTNFGCCLGLLLLLILLLMLLLFLLLFKVNYDVKIDHENVAKSNRNKCEVRRILRSPPPKRNMGKVIAQANEP